MKDVTDRLVTKGFDEEVVSDTIERLKRERFLNDERFAERYVESLRRSRGHGTTRLRLDLIRKGVDPTLAASASTVDSATERKQAMELAIKRASRFSADIPRQTAIRRLAGYLGRKGFPPDAVWDAATRAVDERA